VVVPLDEPPSDPAVDPEPGAGAAEAPAIDGEHDLPDEIPTGGGDDQLVILPADADDGAGRARASETTVLPTLATEPEALPRRHRGVPWRLLLGVLVVAALAGLVVLAMELFQRPSYPVPDLVGIPEAEARNLVSANDWEIEVQRERSDEVPVIGQVVRTAPAAGVALAEGEPFLIVVSQGPLLRELPESTGVAVAEARAALEASQLVVETVDQFDEVVPPGIVISWSVPGDLTLVAGAKVEPQTPVQLVVSAGPAPRIVPNVIGMTSVQAQAELEAVQLVYVLAEQVFSDEIALGSVVAQSVAEGIEVGRGSEIAVTLSKGPDLVIFPDISVASTYDEAAAILREAGFEPVLVFGDAQGAIQSYELGGDTPTAGNTYRRGSVVEITAL
jgi:serine/threonine-protein kinase